MATAGSLKPWTSTGAKKRANAAKFEASTQQSQSFSKTLHLITGADNLVPVW